MRKNDGMRGKWHKSGTYWFCDCAGYGALPLMRFAGMPMLSRKAHPNHMSRCGRCEVLRPLKRDKPKEALDA